MTEQKVYPSKTNELLGLTFIPLFALVCIVVLISDTSHFGWGDLWPGAGAVLFTAGTVADIRQLIRPMPELILDERGIEGEFGREKWDDVTHIAVRWRWLGRTVVRRLVLQLRPGAPGPTATTRPFASWLVAGRSFTYDDRIEIPLWARKRHVLADVRRFYRGEIDD